VVLMVFDHIIVNVRSFRAALGTGFYVNVSHSFFSPLLCLVTLGGRTFHFLAFDRGRPDFERRYVGHPPQTSR
jgi:hypothetical protein